MLHGLPTVSGIFERLSSTGGRQLHGARQQYSGFDTHFEVFNWIPCDKTWRYFMRNNPISLWQFKLDNLSEVWWSVGLILDTWFTTNSNTFDSHVMDSRPKAAYYPRTLSISQYHCKVTKVLTNTHLIIHLSQYLFRSEVTRGGGVQTVFRVCLLAGRLLSFTRTDYHWVSQTPHHAHDWQ